MNKQSKKLKKRNVKLKNGKIIKIKWIINKYR